MLAINHNGITISNRDISVDPAQFEESSRIAMNLHEMEERDRFLELSSQKQAKDQYFGVTFAKIQSREI